MCKCVNCGIFIKGYFLLINLFERSTKKNTDFVELLFLQESVNGIFNLFYLILHIYLSTYVNKLMKSAKTTQIYKRILLINHRSTKKRNTDFIELLFLFYQQSDNKKKKKKTVLHLTVWGCFLDQNFFKGYTFLS